MHEMAGDGCGWRHDCGPATQRNTTQHNSQTEVPISYYSVSSIGIVSPRLPMHVSGVHYRLVGTGEECAATDMIRGGKWLVQVPGARCGSPTAPRPRNGPCSRFSLDLIPRFTF